MDLSGIIAKRERKEQTSRMLRVLGHATVACLVVAAIVAAYLGDRLSWTNGEFRVFAIAAGVYYLTTLVLLPIINSIDYYAPLRTKQRYEPCKWPYEFPSYFGTGVMAKGCFTMHEIEYLFFAVLGLPLIPLRCQAGVNPQLLRSNRMYWRWYEVVYIYLRDWSLAFVIFVAPAIIIRYFIS